MDTKFIGMRDFRANISDYVLRAQKRKVRFVVVSRNKPLFEVTPFDEDETLDSLFRDILAARNDVKEGRVYTHDEILAALG